MKQKIMQFIISRMDKKELVRLANQAEEEKKAAIYELYEKYGYQLEHLEKFAKEGNFKHFSKAVKNFLEEVKTTIAKDFGFEDLL